MTLRAQYDDTALAALHRGARGIPLGTLRTLLDTLLDWKPDGRHVRADERIAMLRSDRCASLEVAAISGLRIVRGEARFGYRLVRGRVTELGWRAMPPVCEAFSQEEFAALAARAGLFARDSLQALLDDAVTLMPERDGTVVLPRRIASVSRQGETALVNVLVRGATSEVARCAELRFRMRPDGGVADPAWEVEPLQGG